MLPVMREARFIDRPAARLVALGVVLIVALSLGYLHRDELFPPPGGVTAADDPIALCVAQRAAEIEKMVADGIVDAGRAELFKSRASALCVAQQEKADVQ